MRYLGGKTRLARPISWHIVDRAGKRTRYIEPFIGGGSVLVEVVKRGFFREYLAGDIHEDLVMFWKALKHGWLPPSRITEEEYTRLRMDYPSPERAYAGFGFSFGGKWFGGYARGDGLVDGGSRENLELALEKRDWISRVDFRRYSYEEWDDLVDERTVVYCDPPYAGTTGYSGTTTWDPQAFWSWCNRQVGKGALVLVSEFDAPGGWVPVWSRTRGIGLQYSGGSERRRIDQLFTSVETL